MSFNKFGKFILVVGIIIFSYGWILYSNNSPIENNTFNFRQRVENDIENSRRFEKRENASSFMIGGGIASIVGIGIVISSKKSES